MENVVIAAIEAQEKRDRELRARQQWGLSNVRRLTQVIESDGGEVSSHLWDLFLFHIARLHINESGKVVYFSFEKRPSKRILQALARHNKAIVSNFNYITRTDI